jgi:hypothetical protein
MPAIVPPVPSHHSVQNRTVKTQPARTCSRYKRINVTIGLTPEFWTGPFVMGIKIATILCVREFSATVDL